MVANVRFDRKSLQRGAVGSLSSLTCESTVTCSLTVDGGSDSKLAGHGPSVCYFNNFIARGMLQGLQVKK